MENKKILKHFTIIGSGTLFNMLLGLLTTPIITRLVLPEVYGKFSIFTLYSNVAVMVLCLGLDQALIRYYYEKKDLIYKKNLLNQCVKLPIIISFLVSIIIILLSYFKLVNFEFTFEIVAFLCIYTIIQIIYRFSVLTIRLEYKSKLYTTLNILLKLIYIILVIPLLVFYNEDSLSILVLSTIITAFICLIISILKQKNLWNSILQQGKNVINNRELLKYSCPFIITMGITTLFQAIDKLSLNYFCTYADVGIYSSAMSLVHIFAIIQTTFNTLWTPMAVEHYTQNPKDTSFYKKGNEYITIIMFFIGINLIFFKDIFALLLGSKYKSATYIFPFLIFNPIMTTISETTVNGLVFKKKSSVQVLIALGACICNIIGNIILVPMIGSKGAAISTGISYILFFTLRTFLSNKYYYVDFKLKQFYWLTLVVSLYALYSTFTGFNVLFLLFYIFCIFILFMLYKDDLKGLIQYVLGFLKEIRRKKNV